ncbi:MAG: CtsR family transcriptional regulator [Christensenellaceae bacterium]|jgi:transcriptional regulator CtsR|nr:CtsR family transcriptional regulator [Christensenellaceae bacterium]
MANISDIIEQFIISTLGQDNELSLSRNYLAQYFNCAPSQINYVLTTRFNFNRGFVTESQRGGGGYIRLIKIQNTKDEFINRLIQLLEGEISYKDAGYMLQELLVHGVLTLPQAEVIDAAIAPKALGLHIDMENKLRAQILKNILVNKLRNSGDLVTNDS